VETVERMELAVERKEQMPFGAKVEL